MERDNLWARLVAGVSILAVGVIVWLDHLHKLHAADYLRWWPLALIALGLAHLLERRWVGASLLIVIGLLCLPRLPFLPHFNISQVFAVWPLLISVGGMTLVMQALRPAEKDAARAGAFR